MREEEKKTTLQQSFTAGSSSEKPTHGHTKPFRAVDYNSVCIFIFSKKKFAIEKRQLVYLSYSWKMSPYVCSIGKCEW